MRRSRSRRWSDASSGFGLTLAMVPATFPARKDRERGIFEKELGDASVDFGPVRGCWIWILRLLDVEQAGAGDHNVQYPDATGRSAGCSPRERNAGASGDGISAGAAVGRFGYHRDAADDQGPHGAGQA